MTIRDTFKTEDRKSVDNGKCHSFSPTTRLNSLRVSFYVDVAMDIRQSSPTFGNWLIVTLSAQGKRLWVIKGFAHGFLEL